MLQSILRLFIGSKNERFIKQTKAIVQTVNDYERAYSALSDKDLANKTTQFKKRIEQGESLDALLAESFAVVREASKRTTGLRHHDVQLIGGIALHRGNIAEMGTGEGKTLVATLPAYLNALTGKGVHIVTVNSYLAQRDAEWMGAIFKFLGLTVGVIIPEMPQSERSNAYAADITYANNNELGFDFLRDNMVTHKHQTVQRKPFFAIIDEVDSILIDEARTPLVISGPVGQSSELYSKIYPLVDQLTGKECSTDEEHQDHDVSIHIKERQVQLTEAGHDRIETLLKQAGALSDSDNLYASQNALLLHYVEACMHAKFIFKRDTHYIVKDKEVIIIDEHTGRTLKGRRWSRGQHQATEAKENLPIQQETQTLASITFQNYFKLYTKLAGMTGTADTEAEELEQIYHLQVIVIPPNKACMRKDLNDIIYMSKIEKYNAIVKEISERHEKKQPILVGTTSIEDSEYLSKLLDNESIPHSVLNAKHHAKEAHIIAEAGEPGRVTIATNMAGRGTDIILGGKWDKNLTPSDLKDAKRVQTAKEAWAEKHQEALDAGGLHVLGTERHESRRVDNQLRGRCARQGDPGSAQFFLSLEDHLFRIFPQGILNFIKGSSTAPGEHLQAGMLNRAISTNQKKMEAHYFDIRKQLLKYDDIANAQRQVLYQQRNDLLERASIHEKLENIFIKCFTQLLKPLAPASPSSPYPLDKVSEHLQTLFADIPDLSALPASENLPADIGKCYYQYYLMHTQRLPREQRDQLEINLLLQITDHHWKEHLLLMEDLRESIGLRGYAQKNPEQEYKIESHTMFEAMFARTQQTFVIQLCHVRLQQEPQTSDDTKTSYLDHIEEQGVPIATPLD